MTITYHIAGPADDEDFAQAEYLAETLMTSLQGVHCVMHTVLPDKWPDFIKQKCAELGCERRAPLVWMDLGHVVGGLPDFSREVEVKYGIHIKHIEYALWPKIAAQNLEAAQEAALISRPDEAPSSGAERGALVSEALLQGNERYLGLSNPAFPPAPLGAGCPAAAVLELTALPAPAHELLGCVREALSVVPCTPVGLELLAVGNLEHAVLAHGAKALLVIGAPSDELGEQVRACALAAAGGADAPASRSEAAALEAMAPALMRVISVAPAGTPPALLETLCLHEWVRHTADQLLRASPVLAELHARAGFRLERLACDADGRIEQI